MIIAIEGTSFAGKTTLIKALISNKKSISFFPFSCYVEALKSNKNIIIPPALLPDISAQLHATRLFLEVELKRYEIHKINKNYFDVFVLDRSIHTLIAHAYAIEKLFRMDSLFSCTNKLITDYKYKLVPTHTFFLNVPQSILEQRFPLNKKRTIFMDEVFNNAFKEHFLTTNIEGKYVLRGDANINENAKAVQDIIYQTIKRE